MDFIIYSGTKYEIKEGTLKLASKGIEDIFDIKNLDKILEITKLNLTYNKIKEIKGLSKLINLEILNLDNNKIIEIKGLENLKNLKELSVSDNNISEIKGLENLKYLKTLNLRRNKIKEVKGLDSLINLKRLNLGHNQITEFKGLGKLVNLQEFRILDNNIKVIKGLGNLKSLKELALEIGSFRNPIFSMRFINQLGGIDNKTKEVTDPQKIVNHCKKLENGTIEFITFNGIKYYVIGNTLDLYEKGIKSINDIEGLEKLKDLVDLRLDRNIIKKIEGLESLTGLTRLDLGENMISKIEGLENLQNLEYLVLSENNLTIIENLDILTKVRQLWIRENSITKVDGLEKLTNLDHLSISKNKISSTKGLETLKKLIYLNLDENQISDISYLRSLKKLKHLNLAHNKIKDISVLGHLIELEYLSLRENEISEVVSISKLPRLKELSLRENKILLPRRNMYGNTDKQLIEYIRLMGKISGNQYSDLSKEQINILKELSEMGHVDAKRVYVSLIINKSKNGDTEAFKNLFEGEGIKSLESTEIKALIQDSNIKFIKSILLVLKTIKYSGERKKILTFLINNSRFIVKEEKNAIADWAKTIDTELLNEMIRDGFLKCLDKESSEIILNDETFKHKILEGLDERGFKSSDSLKILKEFTNVGSSIAKEIIKEKITVNIKESGNFNFSDILREDYFDLFNEKEFDTFLKESSPNFMTEFLNQLNRDYGVYVDDFSHTETDIPEEIKKILGETIIKLISLKEPEKVYKSKKYVKFLSVLKDISNVFSLIDILRETTGINFLNQVKEVWSKYGIVDIKYLTKLLGKLVIYSSEVKLFKTSRYTSRENYYYISKIFRELDDLFKCVLLGYFSDNENTLLEQIYLILESVLNLNQVISDEIEGHFEHVDFYDDETEYERFDSKKEHFKEVFSIKHRYTNPSIRLNIENQKLKISYSSSSYKKEKLEKINQSDIKFVFNRKKLLKDRVIEQKWFKEFLKDYYEEDNYSELILDITKEFKKETKKSDKEKELDLNDFVNFRGVSIPRFESKVLQEIELYSTSKFTYVKEFELGKGTNFFISLWDELVTLRDMKQAEIDEFLKSHAEIRNFTSMGFTTKDGRISGLSIHHGDTTKIPDSIGQLKCLKQLYITSPGINSRRQIQIESLPSSIGLLSLLEVLVVEEQGLERISDSIGNLTELYHLNLNGNSLKKLPESIGNLKKLEFFHLGHNQLSELPKSLGDLKSLITLDMESSFSKSESITPNFDGLDNLEYLNLRHNNFTKINELGNLKNLISLNIRHNKITEIKSLDSLSNLKKLDLGANDLSEIRGLKNLKNLLELDLDGNDLGGGNIGGINGLENLSKLKRLNLGKQKIGEIKGLEKLKNLEMLSLFQNKIREISGLDSLFKLKELHINRNPIKEIEGLESLLNLEVFVIGTCFSKELIEKLGGVMESRHSGTIMNDFDEVADPLKFVEYCAQLKGIDIDFIQVRKKNVIQKFKNEIVKDEFNLKILQLLHKKDIWSLQELSKSPDIASYKIFDFIKLNILIKEPNNMVRLNPHLRKPLDEFIQELTEDKKKKKKKF